MTELQPMERHQTQLARVIEVEQSRAIAQVQGAMTIAKKFPRDEVTAVAQIINECRRKELAEIAIYSYPRGGQRVEGPSIRLAEVLAQKWGNMDVGIVELSRGERESTMQAYACDLQTNTRVVRTFQVPHQRWTKHGAKDLEDPRDVYEATANNGARRLRACILSVIPGHVVDKALSQVNDTLRGKSTEPLEDRALAIFEAFKAHGVDVEMIEERLGHNIKALSEVELVSLRKIFNSLRDGQSQREDWFDVTHEQKAKANAAELKERLKKQKNEVQI